jgi:archaetidylinositol phosphate synthase
MAEIDHTVLTRTAAPRPWDARLARWLVTPLENSWVAPNHLTTVRLLVGVSGWSNLAALLLVLSNFLDHTDGELARLSGKTSRLGHLYDLASDALVTILLFIAIGIGVTGKPGMPFDIPPALIGTVAGGAIALIFYLRMRIEELAGKAATRQAAMGGFETEDVLYLMPLGTLLGGLVPLLLAAAVCAPLYAVWVVIEFRRVARRAPGMSRPGPEVAR